MPRPGWNDQYWKHMDKKPRGEYGQTCPRCGSPNTYYNKRFKTWRCVKCEYSFVVKGLSDERPWWKRIFPFRKAK